MFVWACMLVGIILLKVLYGELDSDKKKKRFLIWSGIIIVLVVGSRYAAQKGMGDINNYYRLYSRMPDILFEDLFSSSAMEPGYLLLNKTLSLVSPWPQTIIYVEALICVAFSFRFIYKYCPDVFLGVIGYLSQGLFVFELTAFRQGIAISICLFAVEFAQKRKFIPFLVTVGVAYMFHNTAIVFFPFYFIAKLRPSFLNALYYAAGTFFLFKLAPSLMSVGSDVTGSDYSQALVRGTLIGPIINISIYALTLFFIIFIAKDNKAVHDFDLNWKWNMTILGVIIYLLRFASVPFERISFYFCASTMVLLPFGIEKALNKNESDKAWINTIYVILSVALYYVRFSGIEYNFFYKSSEWIA